MSVGKLANAQGKTKNGMRTRVRASQKDKSSDQKKLKVGTHSKNDNATSIGCAANARKPRSRPPAQIAAPPTLPSARTSTARFQSAAATKPHMLNDSKKGDHNKLTTSKQADASVNFAGVFIFDKRLIFNGKSFRWVLIARTNGQR